MGRIQGVPNKLTTAVKQELQSLIEQAVNTYQTYKIKDSLKIKE